VAAEQVSRLPDIYYFPAYEIVSAAGREYLADDRRSILEEGVSHVMSLFFRHVVGQVGEMPAPSLDDHFLQHGKLMIDTLCDERRLDPSTDETPVARQMETHDGSQ